MSTTKHSAMRLLCALLLLLHFAPLRAQYRSEGNRSNEGHLLLLHLQYGFHWPAADMAERFGMAFSAGAGLDWITPKNFIIGAQGALLFGNKVEEDVLTKLRGADSLIFNDDLFPAEIPLRQRGLLLNGHIGKLFRSGKFSRSGWRTTLGFGFLQHKIRVQDDPLGFTAQLSGDYKKGYDRLTNGFNLTQFIGYQHLSGSRRVNFMIGLEMTQAWTKNRRSFDFDTRQRDVRKRFDLLFGLRLGWTLPFYVGENPDEIRY